MTTTVIPLKVCQTVKTIKKHQSNSTVATHRIGDWIIRESLQPFQQKENKSSTIKQEQQDFSNKSNVHQWNVSHTGEKIPANGRLRVQVFLDPVSKDSGLEPTDSDPNPDGPDRFRPGSNRFRSKPGRTRQIQTRI